MAERVGVNRASHASHLTCVPHPATPYAPTLAVMPSNEIETNVQKREMHITHLSTGNEFVVGTMYYL